MQRYRAKPKKKICERIHCVQTRSLKANESDIRSIYRQLSYTFLRRFGSGYLVIGMAALVRPPDLFRFWLQEHQGE